MGVWGSDNPCAEVRDLAMTVDSDCFLVIIIFANLANKYNYRNVARLAENYNAIVENQFKLESVEEHCY